MWLSVCEVDGHDISALINVFSKYPIEQGKPTFVIANTIKGKGVSFMENKAVWHHKVPNEDQLTKAFKELNIRKEAING